MPTFLRTLIVLVAISLIGVIWQIAHILLDQYEITNFPPQGHVVLAFGDSLTEGLGASEGHGGYVQALEERLGVSIARNAKSGDTTEMALKRIPESIEPRPNIVIILLGGNDRIKGVPPETTFANLRTIIREFQKHDAVVILIGVQGGLIGDPYDDRFETLAEETGTILVPDILRDIIGNPALMSDPIHPNDQGYERIADRIAPELAGLLASAPPGSPYGEPGISTMDNSPSNE
jgi:lysophospholipase L1-like esterase